MHLRLFKYSEFFIIVLIMNFSEFFFIIWCRISSDLEKNIKKILPQKSDAIDVEKTQNEKFEMTTNRRKYSPKSVESRESEFRNFCKTLNMIEKERKKQTEILKVLVYNYFVNIILFFWKLIIFTNHFHACFHCFFDFLFILNSKIFYFFILLNICSYFSLFYIFSV